MPLAPGTRVGPYQIASPIGAGGMGEVYKARDTRLDRTVAIKVLPPHLAADPEFRERFDREARSISALNHPNICTLYDIGRENDADYLVLEYLEGETLAARIAKGPLPLADALKIAVEIASALDAAHRQGIIHRDLKPGNVMLTRVANREAGSRLLDFGLAKSAPPAVAAAANAAAAMTTMAGPLTAAGSIVGTFQYMAPEQIEGEPADARTDLFAFGAVLYEMLTGRKAFTGKSQASLLGAILKEDPAPVSTVQPMTPPALARVIRTCLAKSPDDRLQTAHDLWLQLQWIAEGGSAAGLPAPVITHRKRHERAIRAAVALGTLVIGAGFAWWLKPAPAVARVITRFSYPLPEGQHFTRPGRHVLAISPDGTKLVYVANKQLYLRAMDQLEAQPVRGTNEDPMEPVFSPDGQWLAYFTPASGNADGANTYNPWLLRKIAVAGGAPVTLGQLAAAPSGVTWANGTIAFGIFAGKVTGIQAIPDSGGSLQTVFNADPAKERTVQPRLLADGKHLLFVSQNTQSLGGEGDIVVQALDGKDRRNLVSGGTNPQVLPTGQLVYIHNGTLLAVPFDTNRLAVTGSPVPIAEGVTETASTAAGQFAIASNGTLAFEPGEFAAGYQDTLVWVDREGHEQPISAKPQDYLYPRLSPDGTKIAVSSRNEEHDIWVFDLTKETLTRLTFGPAFELHPVWTADNKYVFFSSGPSLSGALTESDIFRKAADGTGTTEALTQHLEGGYPLSISPDGKSLVFRRSLPNPGLFVLPLDPKGSAHALMADKFNENSGEISPDGRWIAYSSDESGRTEVYVRPFPAVDSGRWPISSGGGSRPMWARSGRELFFVSAGGMNAVPVPAGPAFTFGKPQRLFALAGYSFTSLVDRSFDISADGKRFLMVKNQVSTNAASRPSITIVTNWFDDVKARMPAGR